MSSRPQLRSRRAISGAIEVRSWAHDSDAGHRSARGVHPTFELSWVRRGALCLEIGRTSTPVAAHEVMIVPAGVEHATVFGARTSAGSVHLGADFVAGIEELVGAGRVRAAFVPGPIASERALTLIRLLEEEAPHGDAASVLAADALGEALVVEVVRDGRRTADRPTEHDPRIRRAIEWIAASAPEPITIDQMARVAGMSRFHFSRTFRKATGRSPYRYVLELRLSNAAALLRRGRVGVSHAATSAGFHDLSRFATAFRARFGVPPSAFGVGRADREPAPR
jgi:AraC family transcriptional regulator